MRVKGCGVLVGLAVMVFNTAAAVRAQQVTPAATPRILSSAPADPNTYGTAGNIIHNLVPENFTPMFGANAYVDIDAIVPVTIKKVACRFIPYVIGTAIE